MVGQLAEACSQSILSDPAEQETTFSRPVVASVQDTKRCTAVEASCPCLNWIFGVGFC